MKTMFKTMLCAGVISFSSAGFAQDRDTVKVSPDAKIKKAAKKVGNKTAEVAVKGTSKVVDKTYKGKVGPGGQTIYIDNRSRYYYVDDKGAKVYVSRSQLKDKPAD